MSPAEISARLATLCATVGRKARASIRIDHESATVSAWLWPNGFGSNSSEMVSGNGADFNEALTNLESSWAERASGYRSATVRRMALAIIELTLDQGRCTDAALRADFEPADVAELGALAVAEATRLSEGGPFAIVETGGSNHVADSDA